MEEPIMDIGFMPTLQHLALVKVVARLITDPDIEMMLDKDLMIPYCYNEFEKGRHDLWKRIKAMVIEKMTSLPPSLRIKVAEYLHYMQFNVVLWMRDHDTHPYRKGFDVNHRRMICWNSNGSIDTAQTAKKYAYNESIDIRDRFIMACNYYLVDVVLDLWSLIKVVGIKRTSVRGINSAVRLWMHALREGKTEPTKEIVEQYLNVHESVNKMDIVLRLSPFFRFLCAECRQDYFLVNPGFVHKDDFFLCYYQMDEAERMALMEISPGDVLIRLLVWPYHPVFMKLAVKVVNQLCHVSSQLILEYMIRIYIVKGHNVTELFREFWSIIPECNKSKIRKDVKRYKLYQLILTYDTSDPRKPIAEAAAELYFA